MPAAPAAPPPAASKPAAAPPPNAKPSPTLTPDPAPSTSSFRGIEDSELDALDSKPAAPDKKPGAKVEPPAKSASDEVVAGSDETQEVPKPGERKKPGPTAELKKVYEELKQKVSSEYEPKLAKYAELEARIAEYEKNGGETQKQYEARVTAAEKRAQELEQEIEFVNFAKSKKFVDEYAKPYAEAYARAVNDFNQLTVRVQTGQGELGEPVYQTRKAGAEDLLALANMPLSEMDEAAERMFGKSAARVIRHVEKVRDLSDKQNEALQTAQKNGEERRKAREQQMKDFQKNRDTRWVETNKAIFTKYPKLFGKIEGDDEHNALLQKGFERADRIFSPNDNTRPKNEEEATQLHAIIRAESAAFRPTRRLLNLANARIAELEAELKAYQDSEPPAGTAGGKTRSAAKNWLDEAEAEIEALNTV